MCTRSRPPVPASDLNEVSMRRRRSPNTRTYTRSPVTKLSFAYPTSTDAEALEPRRACVCIPHATHTHLQPVSSQSVSDESQSRQEKREHNTTPAPKQQQEKFVTSPPKQGTLGRCQIAKPLFLNLYFSSTTAMCAQNKNATIDSNTRDGPRGAMMLAHGSAPGPD